MPLFGVRIPDQLNQKYPNLLPTLESNSERLMTWLDLHHMLADIAFQKYSPLNPVPHELRSYSPWRQPIPHSRTCLNALIPDNYCVCDKRKSMNVSEPIVRIASLALIQRINNFVPQEKCHKLSLESSISAEIILPSSSTAKPKGFESRIEITVSVKPSDAIFRAQLFRTARSHHWAVKGDITRINEYKNQSHCVHERQFKPLCFCL
ncbi:unnamed protein product [Medioppia subpectinata]|uniref:Uncharacterized protein n=1 Tax=Medioppia subpectinata TaxID=1979941 RepID=A0A7R9KHZ3_9ACAR|nr:unnamed protein product [Medioppia subpectinata]CAG2103779.1 unnamed protein product [Medioppia subpectinata]